MLNLFAMTQALKKIFESHILILQDFDFEEFIKEIFLFRHGGSGLELAKFVGYEVKELKP